MPKCRSKSFYHVAAHLHPHAALQQVYAHHERRSTRAPRLDETFQAGERARDDAHWVGDPDPRHRPRSVAHRNDPTDSLYLLIGDRVQGVPPVAEDADDTIRAGDPDIGFARRRKAEEEISGEERPFNYLEPVDVDVLVKILVNRMLVALA